MVEDLKSLIRAWAKGEDCYFAIRDQLLEMGFPYTAEKHKECDKWDRKEVCDLSYLVTGLKTTHVGSCILFSDLIEFCESQEKYLREQK